MPRVGSFHAYRDSHRTTHAHRVYGLVGWVPLSTTGHMAQGPGWVPHWVVVHCMKQIGSSMEVRKSRFMLKGLENVNPRSILNFEH